MKLVATLSSQRLIDLAIQELGDVERVYELCLLNNISLTDEIAAGSVLIIPDFDFEKRRIVTLFSNKVLAPASEDDQEDDTVITEPIGNNALSGSVSTGFVSVLYNQQLIDLAIQALGDVERVYELCLLNDLPLTALLTPGQLIKVPVFATSKRLIVGMYTNPSYAPGSNDDEDAYPQLPPGGIGYMQIGNDFIAS